MSWLRRNRQKKELNCTVCHRPLTLTTIGPISGARGQAEATFHNLPLLSCRIEEHPRQYAMTDFGLHVIDAVFWKGQVALGRPGVLAKVKCYHCGTNLSKEPVRPGEVSGQLVIANLPEFDVRIEGPIATCPRCQTRQLWATVYR